MVVLFTLSCAGWGLLCSALFRRTTFAIIGGYLCLALTMGGPLLAGLAICEGLNLNDLGNIFERAFFLLTPFGVLFEKYEIWETVAALAFQAGMAALALLATLMLVRRPPAPARARSDKPIDDARLLTRRRRRFPFYLFDPQARRGPIPDWINPVLVKEFRFGFMGRAVNLFRMTYGAFAVFVLVSGAFAISGLSDLNSANQHLELFIVSHLLEMLPILLLAVALAAPAITREAEIGNLDLLRQSLLSSGQIMRGKLLAAAATIAPLILALVLANALFTPLIEPDLQASKVMVTVYGTFLVCLLLAYGLGLLASVIVPKTNTSIMLGYGLAAFILIGLFTLFIILSDLKAIPRVSEHHLAILSPVAMLIENLDRYCKSWRPRSEWDPWSELWLVGMAGYAILGAVILAAGIELFSRRRMRER
jgi:ABC-type transport system involved in multi-copper enzyme maturation permease subunit